MRKINQDLPEGADGNLWEKLMADIRGQLFRFVDEDGSFRTLAGRARLHPTTVANIAYGDTRSPLLFTVVKLAIVLGRMGQLSSVFAGANVVDLAEARVRRGRRAA